MRSRSGDGARRLQQEARERPASSVDIGQHERNVWGARVLPSPLSAAVHNDAWAPCRPTGPSHHSCNAAVIHVAAMQRRCALPHSRMFTGRAAAAEAESCIGSGARGSRCCRAAMRSCVTARGGLAAVQMASMAEEEGGCRKAGEEWGDSGDSLLWLRVASDQSDR